MAQQKITYTVRTQVEMAVVAETVQTQGKTTTTTQFCLDADGNPWLRVVKASQNKKWTTVNYTPIPLDKLRLFAAQAATGAAMGKAPKK